MFDHTRLSGYFVWALLTSALVAAPGRLAQAVVPVVESVPEVVKTQSVDNLAGHRPTPTPATDQTDQTVLVYEAFLAGINTGEARLVLERQKTPAVKLSGVNTKSERQTFEASYRVSGTARSKGVWESVQKWRSEYSVDGILKLAAVKDGETGHPAVFPGHFYSLQTTPKKRREIHIEGGVLRETKNNKVRDPRPAQAGFDLLSALFFLPPCHPELRVHTGRDGYEMHRKWSANAMRCSYSVEDEEGGQYEMTLAYKSRDGFIVPADIAVQGPLNGRMVLVNPTIDSSH